MTLNYILRGMFAGLVVVLAPSALWATEIQLAPESWLAQVGQARPGDTLILMGPGVYRLRKDLTVPSEVLFHIRFGARVEVAGGVTLKIEGPLQAGTYSIFSGEGRVELADGSVEHVIPQWWGAFSDGSHKRETTRALQAAMESGHRVMLPRGVYVSDPLILNQDGLIVQGANREKSILRFDGDKGAFLHLRGSFAKLQDFTVERSKKDVDGVTTTGVHFLNSTRSQLQNLRITGFSYGIQISEFGGNNIDHCYIYKNSRVGIYMSGGAHGVSITGGTEIAGSAFGIVLGQIQEKPFRIDADASGVVGQMVSVSGAVIEGIHATKEGVGGIGIYSTMGQKGISVTNTYFELMDVALQLGFAVKSDGKTKPSSAVLNAVFRDNFLSNVKSVVKVGRVSFGDISNNHCAGVKQLFDTDEAGLFQYVKVHTNFNCGRKVSKPFSADFGS